MADRPIAITKLPGGHVVVEVGETALTVSSTEAQLLKDLLNGDIRLASAKSSLADHSAMVSKAWSAVSFQSDLANSMYQPPEGVKHSAAEARNAGDLVFHELDLLPVADIVRSKLALNAWPAPTKPCSLESRQGTPPNPLLPSAVRRLGISVALALLALRAARNSASGRGAASSDRDGLQ